MNFLLQFLIGWIYGHVFEWFAHKYFLHNSSKFSRAFKHHFGVHHRISRKNGMYDENYLKVLNVNNLFEPLSLFAIFCLHLPLSYLFPGFGLATTCSLLTYFIVHRKAHIDVDWGKKWMPWHYEHHMGIDQHSNWGVRSDWVDRVMGTKKVLVKAQADE